jgi:hypothetical protein
LYASRPQFNADNALPQTGSPKNLVYQDKREISASCSALTRG